MGIDGIGGPRKVAAGAVQQRESGAQKAKTEAPEQVAGWAPATGQGADRSRLMTERTQLEAQLREAAVSGRKDAVDELRPRLDEVNDQLASMGVGRSGPEGTPVVSPSEPSEKAELLAERARLQAAIGDARRSGRKDLMDELRPALDDVNDRLAALR